MACSNRAPLLRDRLADVRVELREGLRVEVGADRPRRLVDDACANEELSLLVQADEAGDHPDLGWAPLQVELERVRGRVGVCALDVPQHALHPGLEPLQWPRHCPPRRSRLLAAEGWLNPADAGGPAPPGLHPPGSARPLADLLLESDDKARLPFIHNL